MKQYFFKIIKDIVLANPAGKPTLSKYITSDSIVNYPQYLYKYRTCDKEHNFEMIEEEYLWLVHPNEYDDPFDSAINLNLKSKYMEIVHWYYSHLGEIMYYNIPPKGMRSYKNEHTLDYYKEAQKQFVDANGRFNTKSALAAMNKELRKLPVSKQHELKKELDYYKSEEYIAKIKDKARKEIEEITESLRKSVLVTCLSKRKDNQNMWEKYAANYTGFAIEYARPDYKILNDEQKTIIAHLFQVSYYKRKPMVSLIPFLEHSFLLDLYEKETDISDALAKFFCQVLFKNIEYSGEEEWRMVNCSDGQRIPFPFVSAVYAGNNITSDNLEHLKNICQKKQIALYKQKFDYFTGAIRFDTVLEGK